VTIPEARSSARSAEPKARITLEGAFADLAGEIGTARRHLDPVAARRFEPSSGATRFAHGGSAGAVARASRSREGKSGERDSVTGRILDVILVSSRS